MLKILSNILCDLDPKVKVIGQKAGICDGVPSTSALVIYLEDCGFIRDQARGLLGRNSCPRGRNFALNGTQGEVGVSLKKKNFFFFFLGRLIFILSPHKCKLWYYQTIYYHCIVFLLPLNGNSMCNG